MKRIVITVIDTETAGLPINMKAPHTDTENWPHLLSFGYVRINTLLMPDGSLSDIRVIKYNEYIAAPQPDVINPPAAMAVNGITPEVQERYGVPRGHLLRRMYNLLAESDYVVSHNVEFDQGVINAEFYRAGMEPPGCRFPAQWFCTKEHVGHLTGEPAPEKQLQYRPDVPYKLLSLDGLHEHLFGEPIADREKHGALKDAKACARCFLRLNELGVIKLQLPD